MNTHDIYSTEVPQQGSAQPASNSTSGTGRFTPPPYQPMYFQPEPQVGCGTYLFRFIIILLVVGILGGIGFIGLLVVAGTVTASVQNASETPLTEKFILGVPAAKSKVAVITVEGVITGSEDGFVPKQIRQVINDSHVEAVVLRIESPGGTMAGSDYYHHLLMEMKKERDIPIVVSMGSIAASGGYYIAMVGNEIYAEHSTITGSIGVIVSLFNGEDLCKKIGVESTPITSGNLKAMGSFSKRMSDEEKEVWQRLVDDSFARFKQVIRDGRDVFANDAEKLDQLATGQIYTATEAKDNGLIDEIGFLDDAIKKAMSLAGLTEHNSKAIRYKPKLGFMDALLESRTTPPQFRAETIVEIATPRVYLLCPYVPPM
ncbi:MAG: signal peptide peptidase SppA [Planctomycetaceae bacterium]|jgi:protease-4|nr:signal peptide peptidase SppA [Planctomycetaceae bacterium]